MASREYWFRSRTISLRWRSETLVISGFFTVPLKIDLMPVLRPIFSHTRSITDITLSWSHHSGSCTLSTSPRITIIWPAGTSFPPPYAERRWDGTPVIVTSPRSACVRRSIILFRWPGVSVLGAEEVSTKLRSRSTTKAYPCQHIFSISETRERTSEGAVKRLRHSAVKPKMYGPGSWTISLACLLCTIGTYKPLHSYTRTQYRIVSAATVNMAG